MKNASVLHFRALRWHSLVRAVLAIPSTVAMSSLVATLAGTIQVVAPSATLGQQSSAPNRSVVAENYGRLPLSFEANKGQAGPQVQFQSRGRGYSLFLTNSSAVLALTRQDIVDAHSGEAIANGAKSASVGHGEKTDVVRMNLAGASQDVRVTGVDRLPGTANYFIGNDPANWLSAVPTYAKVYYKGVYPGIDLIYYGNQHQLEYDFVVAPGADPNLIRLRFAGAKKLEVTVAGDLRVAATNGEIAFHKPVLYQVKNGRRQPVEGQFLLSKGKTVGFALGRYDHTRPLVIDPVLVYSTYFGQGLYAGAITVDSSGNTYFTGTSNLGSTGGLSGGVPVTAGAFQTSNHGEACPESYCYGFQNAYVTKLNATGTALIYSTYLGGSLQDQGTGIAVDAAGDAYVTGTATSTNFPVTTGAFQTVNKAGQLDIINSTEVIAVSNAFVSKLNPTGTALIYSTYLGGSGIQFPYTLLCGSGTCPPYATAGDSGSSIAVDSSGSAYVTGTANSTNFPVTSGAFQAANHSPGYRSYTYIIPSNAFITKLNVSGTALVFSTYLGGSGYYEPDGTSGYSEAGEGDAGNSIAVDSTGNSYVTGYTYSSDFPVTSGAFQMTNGAANANENAFVAKLNPTGTGLIYSTYLGGSAGDYALGIAADSSGDAYVTGKASSKNFPVSAGAFQTVNNAAASNSSNAFITKLNSTGSALLYSTYLGGSDNSISYEGDYGFGIAVDGSDNAYVTGQAYSTNFPITVGAFQTVNNAGLIKEDNAFVTKLNSAGTTLLYSTYLGGSGNSSADSGDYGIGIAVDGSGNAYVMGQSSSSNFPVSAGAYQSTQQQYGTTPFITKLNLGSSLPAPTVTVTISPSSIATTQALMVTVTVAGPSGSSTPTGSVILTGSGYTSATETLSSGSVTFNLPGGSLSTGVDTLTASYTPDSSSSSTYGGSTGMNSVTVTAPIPLAGLSPSSLTFTSQLTGTTSTAQTVTLTNSGTGPLTINSIVISGDYSQTHTCGTSLTAGNNCTISIAFAPTVNGSRAGTLTITDNATLSTTSLTFSSQTTGTTSAAQLVSLTNSGNAALTLSSITASGDFTLTQNCGTSVAAGGTCTLSVTFTPTVAGTRTGTITIADNASGSTQAIALSGVGVVPTTPGVTLSPTSLTFSPAPLGMTSAAQVVTLTDSGTAPLALTSITVSGDFSVSQNCGTSVATGASCMISVTFDPTVAGTRTGTLTITDNATNSPQTVSLSGGGESVSVSSTSTGLTISSQGGTASATIQIASVDGFSGSINMSCTVSYQGSGSATDAPSCAISPTQQQVSTGSSGTATLSIVTTAASAALDRRWMSSGTALAAILFFALVPRRRQRGLLLFVLFSIAVMTVSVGCGGGTTSSTPTNPGTTIGSYSVVVTASSGSVSANTTIPLSVQ
jgi:hypothetical protein